MIDVKIGHDPRKGPVLRLCCTRCPEWELTYPIVAADIRLASLVRVSEMHASERHGWQTLCTVPYSRGMLRGARCGKQAGHAGAHGKADPACRNCPGPGIPHQHMAEGGREALGRAFARQCDTPGCVLPTHDLRFTRHVSGPVNVQVSQS
jgi:hypothetical protein